MKKRTSFNMEFGKNIDLSLLRRPLTPFTGFQEAKSAFEKGTAEVRHLLLHECSLIYECNVCRNMFRSLANFISHKRVFCCKSTLEKNDSNDSTDCTETHKSIGVRESLPQKNAAELRQKYTKIQSVEAEDAAATKKRPQNDETSLALRNGVYQCSVQQSTDQSSSSYVFQCPSCSMTFLKSSSVIRHLVQVHNIPMRRVRTMRDQIKKRATESVILNSSDIMSKPRSNNNELNNLQKSFADSSSELITAVNGVEKEQNSNVNQIDNEDVIKCIFCHKIYDRSCTLSAHLQTCHIKLEMLEESAPSTTPTTPSNKNKITAAIAADVEFELNEEDDVKRTFAHLEQQNFGTGLQTVSLDKLDISAGESTSASMVVEKESDAELHSSAAEMKETDDLKIKIETDSFLSDGNVDLATSSTAAKKRKIRTNCVLKQCCRCKICGKQFNALSNLRRHISMFHYRSRKFGCALCDYCAFRRYDIINHLGFVHKMSGENNAETANLVNVNDVHYTKDDMEEDIVLLGSNNDNNNAKVENQSMNNSELTSSAEEPVTQSEKRRRRRNKSIVSELNKQSEAESQSSALESPVEVKITRQTLKRSLTQNTANNLTAIYHSTSTKSYQKRPTRNRIKPVNKDFVYDLNDVVSKEQTQPTSQPTAETETYHLRGSKRRNTLNAVQVDIKQSNVPGFEYIKSKMFAAIKGAARRNCLLLVNMGLAASSTLPEIPSERPQMRSRLTSTQRNDSQAIPIIESTELNAERLKTLPLCDDSYLEKITNESVGSFQMKPCLAQHHSALDSLLQKVDCSKNFFNGGITRMAVSNQIKDEMNEIVAQTSIPDSNLTIDKNDTDITTILPCYITPEEAIPKTFITPLKPQKRLHSLDRLTETINSTADDIYYNATPLEQ